MGISKKKAGAAWFIGTLILLYISICPETDMYVPSFPQMVRDLAVREDQIQGVLGINFLGLCLSSLWMGPLADSFGRRIVILSGMTVFVMASLGCVFSPSLSWLLICRFVQGLGAGAPMTAGFAVLLDRFSPKIAASLVGVMNTVITLVMAGAPILGSWITFHFHWRMNFIVISGLGVLALVSFYFGIPETLKIEDRRPFRFKKILKDFGLALTHPQFLAYVLVCTLIFGGIIVFVSNQSLIFLSYLNISPAVYGFYQASSMASFAVGSLVSGPFIRRYQVIGAKRACMSLVAVGGIGLMGTAFLAPRHAILICAFMVVINLGGGLGIGSIAASAMEIFPDIKATASGVMGFVRLILTSVMVSLSGHFFTGSILPVAIIVGGAQGMACLVYWAAHKARKDKSYTPLESGPLPAIH